jgi:ribosomal protein S18 acetylase RimI-like enzyme
MSRSKARLPAPGVPELLHPLARERRPARYLPQALPLVHAAAQAYFDLLFGGGDAARTQLAAWLARPSSEVALERTTLLLRDETVAGLFVALPGAALGGCRRADTHALLVAAGREGRQALLRRLETLRSLFAPVADDEWYLSKLAVAPALRGRGLGGRLLQAYLRAGEEAGFPRCRLDVEAGNAAAIGLYEAHGFRIVPDPAARAAPPVSDTAPRSVRDVSETCQRQGAGLRYLAMALEV